MEAAASGLPVITVQASSMSEFVIDGDSGFLVPPDDINQMAERIVTLLKNHGKSKKMEQHEGLYEAVLHKSKIYHQEGILA